MFIWVQVLRGLAAAMVVCHHYVASQAEHGAQVSRWLLDFGGSGVDIFFVISGFIMMITQSDIGRQHPGRQFLVRRLMRIAPLYWALTALAFGLASLAGPAVNTHIGFGKFMMSMLFLPSADHPIDMATDAHTAYVIPMSWTLTYEWLFYLVFATALAFGLHAYARIKFIALIFVLFIVAGLLWQPQALLLQVITSPLLLEFLLGCGVAALYLQGVRLRTSQALLLAAIAVVVLANFLHGSVFSRVAIWGLAAFGLVLAATLAPPGRKPGPALRPFARLGDISYSLYLSHFFTLALFVRLQSHIPPLSDGFGIATICAFVLLNLLVAELSYRFIEEPARRFFARPHFGWLRSRKVTES